MSGELEKSKEQSIAQVRKPESSPIETTKSVCSSCLHENDSFALFCEECGTALRQTANCPKCSATTKPRADICEVCGTWLLKGQCMFCYGHVDDGHAFCGECGNPPSGISCPKCGTLSIFGFCKTCSIPLSIQAKEMVLETANSPLFQEMASLVKEMNSSPIPDSKSVQINTDLVKKNYDDQALRLKQYRESQSKSDPQHKPKSVRKPLFSDGQKERVSRLSEEVAQEERRLKLDEERRRQEEEAKRKEEERLLRVEDERRRQEEEKQRKLQEKLISEMSKFGGKTFSSNQEARMFFMNIIAGLPEEVVRKMTDRGMGWRCNAYDCVHDSPGDCANPSQGGVWLFR